MTPQASNELRRLVAEALGTAALLAAIVGSGIVVAQGGDAPARLFQHAVIVGAALTALILAFGPVSGAHFNPSVTIFGLVRSGGGRVVAAGVGAYIAAIVLVSWLYAPRPEEAARVLLPHPAAHLYHPDRE